MEHQKASVGALGRTLEPKGPSATHRDKWGKRTKERDKDRASRQFPRFNISTSIIQARVVTGTINRMGQENELRIFALRI